MRNRVRVVRLGQALRLGVGGDVQTIRMSDGRMPAFRWQEKAISRKIREGSKASEYHALDTLYSVLTELASNMTSDEFEVKRRTLAKMFKRCERSVDTYISKLEKMGVIEKRPIVKDGEYRGLSIKLIPLKPAEGVGQPAAIPGSMGCHTRGSGLLNSLEEHTCRRTNIKEEAAGGAESLFTDEEDREMRLSLMRTLRDFPGDTESHVSKIMKAAEGSGTLAKKMAREAALWAEKGNIKSPTGAIKTVIKQVLTKKGK